MRRWRFDQDTDSVGIVAEMERRLGGQPPSAAHHRRSLHGGRLSDAEKPTTKRQRLGSHGRTLHAVAALVCRLAPTVGRDLRSVMCFVALNTCCVRNPSRCSAHPIKPRRLGPGNLRQPRILRFPGKAVSGQSQAASCGAGRSTELRGDPERVDLALTIIPTVAVVDTLPKPPPPA